MESDFIKELAAISSAVSRVGGLYQKWAQKHEAHYCTVQIFFAVRSKGSVTQKQICESYEMSKQTVNNVIRQLKKNDYIDLVESEADKREKKIVLTQSGEIYSRQLLEPLFELDKKVVERVGLNLIVRLAEDMNTYGDALELEMELAEITSAWDKRKADKQTK